MRLDRPKHIRRLISSRSDSRLLEAYRMILVWNNGAYYLIFCSYQYAMGLVLFFWLCKFCGGCVHCVVQLWFGLVRIGSDNLCKAWMMVLTLDPTDKWEMGNLDPREAWLGIPRFAWPGGLLFSLYCSRSWEFEYTSCRRWGGRGGFMVTSDSCFAFPFQCPVFKLDRSGREVRYLR